VEVISLSRRAQLLMKELLRADFTRAEALLLVRDDLREERIRERVLDAARLKARLAALVTPPAMRERDRSVFPERGLRDGG